MIEFGMGTDFHGQSVTRAARKALRDAVSRSCLSGLQEVMGYTLEEMNDKVQLNITVAVSRPEEVDLEAITADLPIGSSTVQLVAGGLRIRGIAIPEFGDANDTIESALACIEVCLKE